MGTILIKTILTMAQPVVEIFPGLGLLPLLFQLGETIETEVLCKPINTKNKYIYLPVTLNYLDNIVVLVVLFILFVGIVEPM